MNASLDSKAKQLASALHKLTADLSNLPGDDLDVLRKATAILADLEGALERGEREARHCRNAGIVEQHKDELEKRAAAGEKPTAMAQWLRQFGFVGNGATLNGLWRP